MNERLEVVRDEAKVGMGMLLNKLIASSLFLFC
jgi:hypothetical protein